MNYNIKGLDEKTVDKETRIQVATVQSMVKRILYNEGQAMPSVTDFDLIIIDEAHRGYILDKEMCDVEVLYRDQRDYQSKYRTVVEYFDAVKIALTATRHYIQQKFLVSQYSNTLTEKLL